MVSSCYGTMRQLPLIKKKTLFWKSWFKKNILSVQDILNADGNFLTFLKFQDKFNIKTNYLHYFQLIAAIPTDLKKKARRCEAPSHKLLNTTTVSLFPGGSLVELLKFGLTDDANCIFCPNLDSTEHTFLDCSEIKPFYSEALVWFNRVNDTKINLSNEHIHLFTDTAAILISTVSNSHYGMPRGQIHINLPPGHAIMSFETI